MHPSSERANPSTPAYPQLGYYDTGIAGHESERRRRCGYRRVLRSAGRYRGLPRQDVLPGPGDDPGPFGRRVLSGPCGPAPHRSTPLAGTTAWVPPGSRPSAVPLSRWSTTAAASRRSRLRTTRSAAARSPPASRCPCSVSRTRSSTLYTGVSAMNVGDEPAAITLETVSEDGTVQRTTRSGIGPMQTALFWPGGFDDPSPFVGSAIVTSDQPLAVIVNDVSMKGAADLATYNGIPAPLDAARCRSSRLPGQRPLARHRDGLRRRCAFGAPTLQERGSSVVKGFRETCRPCSAPACRQRRETAGQGRSTPAADVCLPCQTGLRLSSTQALATDPGRVDPRVAGGVVSRWRSFVTGVHSTRRYVDGGGLYPRAHPPCHWAPLLLFLQGGFFCAHGRNVAAARATRSTSLAVLRPWHR